MTPEEIIKLRFDYNPTTGEILTRPIRESERYRKKFVEYYNKTRVGVKVGSKNKDGYLTLTVDLDGKKKKYMCHRVAWLLYYGHWPEYQIDHINGVRSDNRIENLRDVTNLENHQNRLGFFKTEDFGVFRGNNGLFTAYKAYKDCRGFDVKGHLGAFQTEGEAWACVHEKCQKQA